MNEKRAINFANIFLAVLAGVIAAILVAFLLFPFIQYLIGKPGPDIQYVFKDHWGFTHAAEKGFSYDFFVLGWLFISSLCGGLVCALISYDREINQILINSLLSIVLVIIVSRGAIMERNEMIDSILILLGIPLGNFTGVWIAGWFRKGKTIDNSQ